MQKGKWGRPGEQGGGEKAELRSYLDSWLSSELFRAGVSKPSAALSCIRAVAGTHTKWACIIQVALPALRRSSEHLQRRSLLPQKPIVKNYKQTVTSLLARSTVITGNHALAAERFCSKKWHECHWPKFQHPSLYLQNFSAKQCWREAD